MGRAEQTARCPWCDGSLRRGANECPGCQLPLTMAAVSGGGREEEHGPRGTTSTASPSPTALPQRFHLDQGGTPHRSHRSHRLRLVSYALAVTAALLLVAGLASWRSVSSPGNRADARTQQNLLIALSRARGADLEPSRELEDLPGDSPSDAPGRISVSREEGQLFAAAQSTSGTCFVLAWRTDAAARALGGTLGRGDPCTGDQVRSVLGARLSTVPTQRRP